MRDLNSESYFGVLWIFFLYFLVRFCMGGPAGVGAYSSLHAPSRPYNILQYIYKFYIQIFWGLFAFLRGFYGILCLLLVCRNVVRRPLPEATLLQYIQCYIHG